MTETVSTIICRRCGAVLPEYYTYCSICREKTGTEESSGKYPPIKSKIVVSMNASVAFSILYIIPVMIAAISLLVQLAAENNSVGGYGTVAGGVVLGFVLPAYHIFCRMQYARIKREYIIPGKIKASWAFLYYYLHAFTVIMAVVLPVFAAKSAPGDYTPFLVFAVLAGIFAAVKFTVRLRLVRKYGKEEGEMFERIILRAGAGKSVFMKCFWYAAKIVGVMSPYRHKVDTGAGKECVRHIKENIFEDIYGNRYYIS